MLLAGRGLAAPAGDVVTSERVLPRRCWLKWRHACRGQADPRLRRRAATAAAARTEAAVATMAAVESEGGWCGAGRPDGRHDLKAEVVARKPRAAAKVYEPPRGGGC